MDKIFINVPYSEKEEAKSEGARWDPKNKSWFISKDMDKKHFSKWLQTDKKQHNHTVLMPPIFLVESQERCWKCSSFSKVYCFAASGFTDEAGDYDYDGFTTFSNVQLLSQNLEDIVKTHAEKYKPDHSKTASALYYMNHCQHCNAKLGDFYMHNEPSGAFQPFTPTEGKAVKLFEIRGLDDECYLSGSEGITDPCYIESDARRMKI